MDANITNLILVVFAIYRASIMLAEQEGPFDIFTRIRLWITNQRPPYWIVAGISCPECLSFWLSLPVIFMNTGVNRILLWIGVSGIVNFMLRITRGRE